MPNNGRKFFLNKFNTFVMITMKNEKKIGVLSYHTLHTESGWNHKSKIT